MSQDEWVRRPFDPNDLAEAKALAAQYTVISRWDVDEGCYIGRTLEMPAVMGDGKTPSACHKAVMEATMLSIATDLEHGETPPQPVSDEKRTAQLNVRLTEMEKLRIEEAARQAGFRGVSDFVRAAALDKAG